MALEFDLDFEELIWNTSWRWVEHKKQTEGSWIYVGRNGAGPCYY